MLLRTTLIMGPAVIMPRAASFIIVFLLTHRLAPPEFGLFSLVILLGEVLDMTTSNWIRLSLLRLDVGNSAGWRAALRRSYMLCFFSTICGFMGAAAASVYLVPNRSWEFCAAVCIYILSNGALRIGLTSLQMQRRNATYSLVEGSRAILQVVSIACLLLLGQRFGFFTYSLGTSVVSLAASFVAIGLSRTAIGENESEPASFRERLYYGAPVFFLTIATYVVTSSDRFFLQSISGPSLVGLYSAAYIFGRAPFDIVANAVNQGAFPEFMRRFDQHGTNAARAFAGDIFDLLVLLTLSTLAVLYALAPAISLALLPVAYRATARSLIPLIAVAGFCYVLKAFAFDNIFHLYRRNWLQLVSYAPAALVTLLAAFALVPSFGAIGAALAAIAGMAAGLIGSMVMTRPLLPIPIHGFELLKSSLVAAVSGLAGMIASTAAEGLPKIPALIIALFASTAIWCVAVALIRPKALAGIWRNAVVTKWIGPPTHR